MFRYSRNGENKWMGLGAVADKPFTEARDEAAMLRVQVKRGGHPLAEKREVQANKAIDEKPQAPAFYECAMQYIAAHESSWKNDKHIAQWKSTLKTYCGPVIDKTPVDEITIETPDQSVEPPVSSRPFDFENRPVGHMQAMFNTKIVHAFKGETRLSVHAIVGGRESLIDRIRVRQRPTQILQRALDRQ